MHVEEQGTRDFHSIHHIPYLKLTCSVILGPSTYRISPRCCAPSATIWVSFNTYRRFPLTNMSDFGKALNRIVQGRDESAEEMENVAVKRARGLQDNIVDGDSMQEGATTDVASSRKILLIRGYVAYTFEPVTGSWERISDARRDRSYFETVLLNGFIYAIGSMNVTAAGTVERFVISKNVWEVCSPLPAKIRSVAAAVIPSGDGDAICVCGGIDLGSMLSCDSVYIYNPLNFNAGGEIGGWEVQGSKMLTPRYRHAAILFEGFLWAIGGIIRGDDGEEYTATTEIMSCTTGIWSTGPTMCARRAIDVAPVVIKGVLYVFGGNVGKEVVPRTEAEKVIGTIERYNSATGQFTAVSMFPHQRKGFSAAALPGDDNVYCFGGREDDLDLTTWDAYNVITEQWQSSQPLGDMNMPFMDSLYGRAISMTL